MAAITRLLPDGYGGRRAGSFAGKTEATVTTPPAVLFTPGARTGFTAAARDAFTPGARATFTPQNE